MDGRPNGLEPGDLVEALSTKDRHSIIEVTVDHIGELEGRDGRGDTWGFDPEGNAWTVFRSWSSGEWLCEPKEGVLAS